MIWEELIPIAICLVFSAFFSGMEIAFVSSDKITLELIHQKGGRIGWVLGVFHRNRAHFLATTLVGNNLALVTYGVLAGNLLTGYLEAAFPEYVPQVVIIVVQSLISTLIVLITAEFIPKSLFMLNPNFMLRLFALPMGLIYLILWIAVWPVVYISKFIITQVFKLEYSEEKPVYGITDLNNYIRTNIISAPEEDHEIDTKIFNNALEFKEVKVRECMIPRTEIIAVDIDDDISELKQAFIDSGHSKIVAYKESIDDIIGYCHSLELFKKPSSIKKILTPIIIVPETTPANELLVQFINEHKSLALVVDEFGGTSGIVSMEDVIEEIFGEIRDEHDDEDLLEDKLSDTEYLLSARHEIDYLNETYALDLPEGDFDTLGGLILNVNEDIPNINDLITHENFEFVIVSMQDNRIDHVKLSLIDLEENSK